MKCPLWQDFELWGQFWTEEIRISVWLEQFSQIPEGIQQMHTVECTSRLERKIKTEETHFI